MFKTKTKVFPSRPRGSDQHFNTRGVQSKNEYSRNVPPSLQTHPRTPLADLFLRDAMKKRLFRPVFLQNSVQLRFFSARELMPGERSAAFSSALGSPRRSREPVEGFVCFGSESNTLVVALPGRGVHQQHHHHVLSTLGEDGCGRAACSWVDKLSTVLKYRGGGKSEGSAHAGLA